MALISAAKRLFIPHKSNFSNSNYTKDMQAIEIFNPINILTAGSGVTLVPSDGSGPTVEISATGGGGGTSPGLATVQSGPDSAQFPFAIFFDPTQVSASQANCALWSNSDVPAGVLFNFSFSWLVPASAGQSVSFFPIVTMPAFTGVTDIGVTFLWSAADIAFTDYIFIEGNGNLFTTGETYQFMTSDCNVLATSSTDLSLVAGTGTSGNGIVSAAGGMYFTGFQIQFDIPLNCVITPF